MDENADDPDAPDVAKYEVTYGRLEHILAFKLGPTPQLGDDFMEESMVYLACLSVADVSEGYEGVDGRDGVVLCREPRGTPRYVHLGTIESGVGRVALDDGWGIVDLTADIAKTQFFEAEVPEHEEE